MRFIFLGAKVTVITIKPKGYQENRTFSMAVTRVTQKPLKISSSDSKTLPINALFIHGFQECNSSRSEIQGFQKLNSHQYNSKGGPHICLAGFYKNTA